MWELLTGCLVALLLFYYTLKDLVSVYVYGMPPGPISLPLIGGLHHLSIKQPHLSLTKLGKKYGGIFSIRLGPAGRVVMLQDMKLISQVFDHPDCNDRPPMGIFKVLSNGADGIGTCSYGKKWKELTQIFQRGMAKLSHDSLEDRADLVYKQLFDEISATKLGEEYDICEDVYYTCNAIFSSLVYGITPENLASKELAIRIKDQQIIMAHLYPMHPVNMCPCLVNLPLPGVKHVQKIVEVREKAMHASYMNHHADSSGQIHDIMDIIVSYIKDKEDGKIANQKDIQLPDILLSSWTMYLAGCQTVVDILKWVILYLCCYPHVQRAMQEEIDQITQRTTKVLEEKSNLHYTRAAIFEMLRLSSTVAMGLPKYNTREIKLGQYTIPKGTQIMANQWPIHHDEAHWPDPSNLKPERFLDEDGTLFSYQHIFHKMPYIPFSFGKRPCPGRLIALDLILIFVVGLLRRYDLRLPKGYIPDLQGEVNFNLEPTRTPVVITER